MCPRNIYWVSEPTSISLSLIQRLRIQTPVINAVSVKLSRAYNVPGRILWLKTGNTSEASEFHRYSIVFGAVNVRGFLTLIRVKEAVVSPFPFEMVKGGLCYTDTSIVFIVALIHNETSQLSLGNHPLQNNVSCSPWKLFLSVNMSVKITSYCSHCRFYLLLLGQGFYVSGKMSYI